LAGVLLDAVGAVGAVDAVGVVDAVGAGLPDVPADVLPDGLAGSGVDRSANASSAAAAASECDWITIRTPGWSAS
jgi:hypothetical protein